uniref:Uncharacterized protein n=1 Tax=Arundo donax TaxID=35708 RepID=A0A0A9HKD2_ARUDO
MMHLQLSRWERGANSASLMSLSDHKGMLAVMLLLLQSSSSWHATMHSTAAALNLFTASLSLPCVSPVLNLRKRTDH